LALMIEERADSAVNLKSVMAAAESLPIVHGALTSGEIRVVVSPWMQFNSDGLEVPQRPELLANRMNLAAREPCMSILSTIVITPNEELGVCCGLPRESIPDLHAGSLKDHRLRDLLNKAGNDFLKLWIFVEGPEHILAWAAEKDSSIQWENRFAHNCDACRFLYSSPKVLDVIYNNYEEKIDDILGKFAFLQATRAARSDRWIADA